MEGFINALTELLGLTPKTQYIYKGGSQAYDKPQVIAGYENQGGNIVPIYTDAPTATPVQTAKPNATPAIDLGAILQTILSAIQSPSPTPTATPVAIPVQTPTPQTSDQFFNFAPHIDENTKRTIYAPPNQDLSLYQKYFPQEATSAAVTAFNESMYNPAAQNQNLDPNAGKYYKSWDRGYFQNNDVIIKDLLNKYPNTMAKMGIRNFDDWANPITGKWKDKETNFAVTKLHRDKLEDRPGRPAWGDWRGWEDQGFVNVGNPNIDYGKAGQ